MVVKIDLEKTRVPSYACEYWYFSLWNNMLKKYGLVPYRKEQVSYGCLSCWAVVSVEKEKALHSERHKGSAFAARIVDQARSSNSTPKKQKKFKLLL